VYEATAENLAADAMHDPLAFIEKAVSAGGAARDRAQRWLKESIARIEAEIGTSIYEHALPHAAKRLQRERSPFGCGVFHMDWPYCFTQLEAGGREHLWLPLNRHYKPLGKPAGMGFDYEDFAGQAWQFPHDPREIEGVWWRATGHQPYLYGGDGLHTLREFDGYLARIGKLLAGTGDRAPGYAASLLRSLPARKGDN